MGTTMRLVYGATEIPFGVSDSNNDSPYGLKTYDFGSPFVREVVQDAAGVTGTLDYTALTGSASLTFDLEIFDSETATRHQNLETLRNILRPDKRFYVYAQLDGWAEERRIICRGTPMSCVVGQSGGQFLETSIVVVAPSGVWETTSDPLSLTLYPIYGDPAFSIISGGTAGVSSGGSLAFSTISGGTAGVSSGGSPALFITSGSGSNIGTAFNDGTLPSFPQFVIYGGCANPVILDQNTGAKMALNYTLAPGHFIVIDMNAKSIYLDGNTITGSLYSTIDWSRSTWFGIDGDTILEFDTSANDSSSYLTATYRPRYY